MRPQSISMIRSSTSMQAQFRPISPRPPRNVIFTGAGMARTVLPLGAPAPNRQEIGDGAANTVRGSVRCSRAIR
jgi:hypothetical protein